MKTMKTILTVCAISTLLATPVYAHDAVAFHGNDVGRLKFSHHRVFACDKEKDGNRAYAVGKKPSGAKFVVVDKRAKDGYCNSKNPSGSVDEFKMCERGNGCTRWKH
jgi:hypothetical protein